MIASLTRLRSKLNELVISKEAEDPAYVLTLFRGDTHFMRYQYSGAPLNQSIYDNVVLRYRHYERLCALMELATGVDRILDIGCGYGDLSLELANNGKEVVLLDIWPKVLLMAKRRFSKLGLQGDLIRGDASHLPFKSSSFDMSFSNQVVEHIADPVEFIREKLRVSKLKAIVMCGNSHFSMPGASSAYQWLRNRRKPEKIPDIGNYDEIYYLNHELIPLNSIMTILVMKLIARLPLLKRVLAGNVAKVYHKKKPTER
jgi:ubiquinone/menaquinone biosynthesis C-methylase UbiE